MPMGFHSRSSGSSAVKSRQQDRCWRNTIMRDSRTNKHQRQGSQVFLMARQLLGVRWHGLLWTRLWTQGLPSQAAWFPPGQGSRGAAEEMAGWAPPGPGFGSWAGQPPPGLGGMEVSPWAGFWRLLLLIHNKGFNKGLVQAITDLPYTVLGTRRHRWRSLTNIKGSNTWCWTSKTQVWVIIMKDSNTRKRVSSETCWSGRETRGQGLILTKGCWKWFIHCYFHLLSQNYPT